ncbi:restriction endonuclease subunit S [Helicobacter sp. 23-1045]
MAQGGKWEEFRIGDLFDIVLSSGDNKANELPSGEIPLVSAGESNNGITKHIKHGDGKAQIFPANILTADMFGNFFYQPKEFYAVSHGRVNMLFPKSQYFSRFNRFIGGFICAYSFKFKSLFGFSNMLSKTKIEKETLELPTMDGKIAFDFMESYIKELEAQHIRELEAYLEATGLKDCELNAKEKTALNAIENGATRERERE